MRGGQWQALRLAQGLAQAGHSVTLLARGRCLDMARTLRVDCGPLTAARVRRLSRQVDLVHAHDARSHTIATLLSIAPLIVRIFEFPAIKVSWDSNAYGSIVWTLLGLHATHIITDLIDTIVLAALMFSRHGDNRRRYGDVQDNALYWNFVILTWLPIYACLYWLPRLWQ